MNKQYPGLAVPIQKQPSPVKSNTTAAQDRLSGVVNRINSKDKHAQAQS